MVVVSGGWTTGPDITQSSREWNTRPPRRTISVSKKEFHNSETNRSGNMTLEDLVS